MVENVSRVQPISVEVPTDNELPPQTSVALVRAKEESQGRLAEAVLATPRRRWASIGDPQTCLE